MSKSKWDANNIADQSGKIAIVTGASSGIGYETARVLANKNAKVIIAVRNPQKGEKALDKIKAENAKADASVMIVDLADLKSVEKFAKEFQKKYDRLDMLINNAGVMVPPYSKTTDGFELQFGTNHLGHYALTGHLVDLLKKTSGSRVVNVSSMAHNRGKLKFDDLNWETRKYKPWSAYGDSKIANIYFTRELKKRFEANNIDVMVTAAHPGWTATELQRNTGLASFLNNFFAQDISMGALPTLYAAVAEDVSSGDYFGPSGFMEMNGYPKKVDSNKLSKDDKIAVMLWEVSEDLTKVSYNLPVTN